MTRLASLGRQQKKKFENQDLKNLESGRVDGAYCGSGSIDGLDLGSGQILSKPMGLDLD